MAVVFRNVDVAPGTPVEAWPFEAVVAAIERGTITDWATLTRRIRPDPWGPVARQVEAYLGYERPWGVAPLLERAIRHARDEAEAAERRAVAAEVRDLVERAGLSPTEFASRIGTSRSRLSTYRNGRVTPSAALLVRMRRLVDRTAGPRRSEVSAGEEAHHACCPHQCASR
jgi:DNA-binding transcriptional regulator YiaG